MIPSRRFPFYIDDTADLDLLQLRIKAKHLQREKGIQMIVLDYLQLVHAKRNNRE
ncbi:MAG: DnaB-like helicase C-terminal domain-containing protein [Flavobacteriales bacterium AspAUS03]